MLPALYNARKYYVACPLVHVFGISSKILSQKQKYKQIYSTQQTESDMVISVTDSIMFYCTSWSWWLTRRGTFDSFCLRKY